MDKDNDNDNDNDKLQNNISTQPAVINQTDGMAVTSLVTGILAIVTFWFWPVSLIFIILGFVFGGISYAKKKNGMALAGMICSGAAVLFMVAFIIFLIIVAQTIP